MWNKTFRESGYDEAHSVQETADGRFIVTGVVDGLWNQSYNSNVWLIKTDNDGTISF